MTRRRLDEDDKRYNLAWENCNEIGDRDILCKCDAALEEVGVEATLFVTFASSPLCRLHKYLL